MSLSEAADTLREAVARTDQLLTDPRWQSSVVLKIGAKKITAIRENLQSMLDTVEQEKRNEEAVSSDRTGMVCIYILLYHQDGRNQEAWNGLLRSLDRIFQGRPIYGERDQAQKVIDSKGKANTDAYVSVWIRADKIIAQPNAQQALDRFMQPLLVIQPDAISVDKIESFYRADGQVFRVDQGRIAFG